MKFNPFDYALALIQRTHSIVLGTNHKVDWEALEDDRDQYWVDNDWWGLTLEDRREAHARRLCDTYECEEQWIKTTTSKTMTRDEKWVRHRIAEAVKRVVAEYGDVLKRLADE
jgi:hypothetical protein